MFTRRSRIFLAVLILASLGLLARAAQVQVVEHGRWSTLADEALRRAELLPTTRGRLLDVKGRPIALDVPSRDARVDYQAMLEVPDDDWVYWTSRGRLRGDPSFAEAPYAERKRRVAAEEQAVRRDLDETWRLLAEASGRSVDDVQAVRRQIVAKVRGRRDAVRRRAYAKAAEAFAARGPTPWWRRWVMGGSDRPPSPADFDGLAVAEESQAHVVLPGVDAAAYNRLYGQLERLPWLSLAPSTARAYPYGPAACHAIGRLSAVTAADLADDPDADDDLRRYFPHDATGRTGLEAIWERRLRGTRGRVERDLAAAHGDADGEERPARELSRVEPIPGRDVRTSIDIALQAKVQRAFADVLFRRAVARTGTPEVRLAMPGAAVVIDVATGQVRAMASYPDYDPNAFDALYPSLAADAVDRPLMNRATQFALEPGSTMKPLVGLAAARAGVVSPTDAIECTGYLALDGRQYHVGRCWTMNQFAAGHHSVPWSAPHATGFLALADALERSCNVYFETLGDRLGVDGLSAAMRSFGLGRPTGVGLAEVAGTLPDEVSRGPGERRSAAWFAAIGQGVSATPIQMANVAATIARGGAWRRPTLAVDSDERPGAADLGLPADALVAARLGMVNVVNAPAGTGKAVQRADVVIAGKTGTAQAAPLSVRAAGPDGEVVMRRLALGTPDRPNPDAPWYLGELVPQPDGSLKETRDHAWYIGFAPADDPTIAFAVMVEYGGSGGTAAGSVAAVLIQACVEEGYLTAVAPVAPVVPE